VPVSTDFIDPFFEALGWDLHNQRSEHREVLVEYDVFPGSREKVDYCFRVERRPMFFVEAKASWERLDNHYEQICDYSELGQMPVVILTSFQELRVYARRGQPARGRSGRESLIEVGRVTYDAYAHHWAQMAGAFSHAAVRQGAVSALLQRVEQSGGRFNLFAEAPLVQEAAGVRSQDAYSIGGHGAAQQSYGRSAQSLPMIPTAPPHAGGGGSNWLLPVAGGGVLVALLLGGTCAFMMSGSSAADQRMKTSDPSPANAPPRTASDPGGRQCPLVPWDGRGRGWAKVEQRQQGTVEIGYYLRITTNQDKSTSRAAVAQAWSQYVSSYLAGASCPYAKEMVFFDKDDNSGAGIFFPQPPPGWDRLMQERKQWMLLDATYQPMMSQVCFFLAEWRRPPGW